MIAVMIEKEVKEENRVIGKFTLRQVICFGIAVIILALYYFFVRPTMDMMVPAGIVLGAGVWYFGFHTRNGMHTEYFVIKKICEMVLANINRRYRTKNEYISMFNEGYAKEKADDLRDHKKKQYFKKLNRKDHKRRKKSKMKGYA